ELLELVGLGDKVCLTIDLYQHPDLAAHVDVTPNGSLTRLARRSLGCFGGTTGAQDVDGSLHVAIRLLQRILTLHHARTCAIPEFFDLLRCYGHPLATCLGVSL